MIRSQPSTADIRNFSKGGNVPDGLKAADAKQTRKELRRKRSEVINLKSKTVKPLEKRIKAIENEIEAREIELDRHNQAMQKATEDQDGSRITELSRSLHACQTAIDELFKELEKITDELDAQNAEFDRRLNELDDVRN